MAKKKVRDRTGLCKLTQKHGVFVDSHLLPKALTKADGLGPGLLQIGYGKIQKRKSSWYDPALVIRDGEDILARYDDAAIAILRRHSLVWSGWGPRLKLPDCETMKNGWGLRTLVDQEWRQLRLFFLSLLWRAAATSRPEFEEVVMPEEDLERLRIMVRDGNPEPLEFYPVSLTQLSTLGVRHNHAPIAQTKLVPDLTGSGMDYEEPFFRFCLDGLIAHISRMPIERNREIQLKDMWVGSGDNRLTVIAVPWESSSQLLNGIIIEEEVFLGRPLFEIGSGPFSS